MAESPALPDRGCPDGVTRREFVNGVAVAIGAAPWAAAAGPPADPPARTGLQGQTDEVMATAHAWRDDPQRWRQTPPALDDGVEDLVVVGAGLSGLAGAYLYLRHASGPVRVLLLDPMDDVGGHAKRNEFTARNGRRLVGYGGSQSLDSPGLFSPAVHAVLRGLGIELRRFERGAFDRGWYARHGLDGHALHFGRAPWGAERLVLRRADDRALAWIDHTPLSPRARADLRRLHQSRVDPWPGLAMHRRRERLAATTYRDYLAQVWQVAPEVQRFYAQDTLGYFGVGTDATSALDAYAAGLPGFAGQRLGRGPDALMSPSGRMLMASEDDYVYHFPDGNAGVARALVRSLIPQALPRAGMEALADGRLDYDGLDRPAHPVRIRLRATAVWVGHVGSGRERRVEVHYVDEAGRLRAVQARQALLACWHRVIDRLADELPEAQRAALRDQVKVPLVYANVLVADALPWQRAGVHTIKDVGGFWDEAALDYPVRLGDVHPAGSPREPMLVHLAKVVVPGDGQAPRQQAAIGRAQLLGWRFEDFEARIRELLQGALGGHGFDARRDIEAITVNRWAHGYAYEYMRPWDAFWPAGPLPNERARRGWGQVAIASSDAGAYAYAHSAIDQAARAVQELLPQARLPAWSTRPGPDERLLTRT